MSERLNTSDLAERLARRTRLNRSSAEKFIDAISEFVTKGIETNKSVKIIGFGIFKVMLVRERESVHIQTGERFVIPAHHKLSFIPDKEMKDSINGPFAYLEPVEVDDRSRNGKLVDIDDEEYVVEAEDREVKNAVDTETVGKQEEVAVEVVSEQEEAVIPEVVPEPEIPVVSEDEIEIKQQYYDIISPVISIENESEEETIVEIQEPEETGREAVIDSQTEAFYRNDKTEKSNFGLKSVPLWMWFPILPLLVVIGVGIGTYAFWHFNTAGVPFDDTIDLIADVQGSQEPLPLGVTLLPDSVSATPDTSYDSAIDTAQQPSTANGTTNINDADSVQEKKPVFDWLAPTPDDIKKEETKRADKPNKEIERKNRELLEKRKKAEDAKKAATPEPKEKIIPARVRMTQGKTLREIALEQYGDKVFWVYIYEYNKNVIKDYDHIPVGTELRLPSPKTYGIDPNSQASVEKAFNRQRALYSKKTTQE
jgi:nucleoid DNA-binding protein